MFGSAPYSFAAGPLCQALEELLATHADKAVDDFGALLAARFTQRNAHVYALYCAGQAASAARFDALVKTEIDLVVLVHAVGRRPACRRLGFGDFNVAVMQRLTKYPLLIDGIIKCTTSKEDLAQLTVALEASRRLLLLVNTVVKETEDWARIVFVQVARPPPFSLSFLSSGGRLLTRAVFRAVCRGILHCRSAWTRASSPTRGRTTAPST